jgi:cytochrome c-type biogenesis protein CcmH/NrfF
LNLVPWLVPIVGLLAGAAIWAWLVRRRVWSDGAPVNSSERSRIDRELHGLEEPG